MCLFPRLILNKKYIGTKKNKFKPPILTDERLKYVAIGCGVCSECLKKKAKQWKTRLFEEYKSNEESYFVTLTFSDESLMELSGKYECADDNEIATVAVRLFLERWRKKYKKSLRHFLITELGEENNRIHLHGLIFEHIDKETLESHWQYGWIYIGDYVNDSTIHYVCKYITKFIKGFTPKILCSKGIGSTLIENPIFKEFTKYKDENTKDYYKLYNGVRVSIPSYYRNKLYTDEMKEKLWKTKLDKNQIFCKGVKFDVSTQEGIENYYSFLEYWQVQEENNGIKTRRDNKHKTRLKNINLKD